MFVIGCSLIIFICFMFILNLYLSWKNYSIGISLAETCSEGAIQSTLILSRAMDFAFTKLTVIFLGFILVFIGTLYVLRLSQEMYSLGLENEDTKVRLETASPGLVLATLGVVLIIFTFQEKSYVEMSGPVTPKQTPSFNIESAIEKIKFKPGSPELKESSLIHLKQLCNFFTQQGINDITIDLLQNDCSKSQPEAYCASLRERRLTTIQKYLSSHCSSGPNIEVIGWGEYNPKFGIDTNNIDHKLIINY